MRKSARAVCTVLSDQSAKLPARGHDRHHRLHHKASGTGIENAHRTQGKQRDRLHCIAQFHRVVDIGGCQRPNQRFVKCTDQRRGRSEMSCSRQMTSPNGSFNPRLDFGGDFTAARNPRFSDIDIDRLGKNARASLRFDTTWTAMVVTAAASAEDGPGAASAARRIAVSSARETSAISSEIRSALDGK